MGISFHNDLSSDFKVIQASRRHLYIRSCECTSMVNRCRTQSASVIIFTKIGTESFLLLLVIIVVVVVLATLKVDFSLALRYSQNY